jgi:hypothetical protein
VPDLEGLDILARNGGLAGKCIDTDLLLLAHEPNGPPEDGQLGCSMWIVAQRSLANWVEDYCLQTVSTYMP